MPDHKNFEAYCKQHKLTSLDLNKTGTWLVYGDDQGDMHSSYTPLLGTVTGTMREAINKALEVDEKDPRFFFHYWAKGCWGKIILAKRL